MKWKELNGKHNPPFDQPVIIWVGDTWKVAMLHTVTLSEKGKQYEFIYSFDNTAETGATHFCVPEPPKPKEQ